MRKLSYKLSCQLSSTFIQLLFSFDQDMKVKKILTQTLVSSDLSTLMQLLFMFNQQTRKPPWKLAFLNSHVTLSYSFDSRENASSLPKLNARFNILFTSIHSRHNWDPYNLQNYTQNRTRKSFELLSYTLRGLPSLTVTGAILH